MNELSTDRVPSLFIIPLICFFVGLFLFLGLLYEQKAIVILCALILGVAGGAKFWSMKSLSGIRCHSMVDKQRVFPGEKFRLSFDIKNTRFLPVWLRVRTPTEAFIDLAPSDRTIRKESGLLWYQRARFQWEMAAQHRGVYRLGSFRIEAGDLLGFFQREKRVDETIQVIVYPQLVELEPFTLPRRDFFGIPGAKSPVQDPIYILGTRDYQHGRPARTIHWKATARYNRLQEKVFEPSEQEKTVLAVDVDGFAQNEADTEFEHTLEKVASLAVRLHRLGQAVGLVTNGALEGGASPKVPIARNPQQIPAILEALARLTMKPNGRIADILDLGDEPRWVVSCVHFSFDDNGISNATKEYLSRRKMPVVFFLCRSSSSSEEEAFRLRSTYLTLNDIHRIGTEGGDPPKWKTPDM